MAAKLKKIKVVNYIEVFKETFNGFIEDKGLKLSASLAYYTIFSLAPMLIVLLSVGGLFYGEDALQGKIFSQINDFIGNEAALQIQDMLKNLALSGKSVTAIVTGVVTLLIGATGIFVEIQDSLNQIWRVKTSPKTGWVKLLMDRILSLSMVASLGFLLIVSLMVNSVVLILSSSLSKFLPDFTLIFIDVINLGITFGVLVSLFAIIYKVLPDAEIPWHDVRTGLYIAYASISSIYGATGTIVVIAVWVYYSAAILFFGAEFTWAYAKVKDEKIKPSKHAVSIKRIEIEQGHKPVDQEKITE
jgi:membrane protein